VYLFYPNWAMEVRPFSVRLVDIQISEFSPRYEIATGVTDLAKEKGASIARVWMNGRNHFRGSNRSMWTMDLSNKPVGFYM